MVIGNWVVVEYIVGVYWVNNFELYLFDCWKLFDLGIG